MKIFGVAFLAVLMMCPDFAYARPWHHPPHPPVVHVVRHHPPHPPVVHVVRHHPRHDLAWGVLAGVTGVALGSYVVANQARDVVYQPNQYYPEIDKKCFVMVSKSSGKVTKKCVNAADNEDTEVIYVD